MSRFRIRVVEDDDFDSGFLGLLGQLTPVPTLVRSEFAARRRAMAREGSLVVVGEVANRLVATGKLIIETKFHNTGAMGHIEDVVVDAEWRARGFGREIVLHLVDSAFAARCYKISLNCNPDQVGFYERCGFTRKGSEMSVYRRSPTA